MTDTRFCPRCGRAEAELEQPCDHRGDRWACLASREQPFIRPYMADRRASGEAASEVETTVLAFDAAFPTAGPTGEEGGEGEEEREEERADSRGGGNRRRISLTGPGALRAPWPAIGMSAVALIAAAVVSAQLVALTTPADTGPSGMAIALSDAPSPAVSFTLPASALPSAPTASASPPAATPSAVPSTPSGVSPTQPAGGMPVGPPSPTATYAQPVPAVLVDPASGHCLNVDTADNSVGIWTCDGRPTQQWVATTTAEVRSQGTGLCLAPASDTVQPGTRVMVRSCTGSDSQKWAAQPDGSLLNTSSGLCLDVLNGYMTNGAPLQLWTCG